MVVVIVFLLMTPILGDDFKGDKIYHASRVLGHKLKTTLAVSLEVCRTECLRCVDCLSVNYNRYYTLCELNNYGSSGNILFLVSNIQEESGWVHLNIEKNVYTDLGLCNDNACPAGTVCRNGNCSYEYCAPIDSISVTRATIQGNMNNVGSKIRFVCDAGYHMIGSDVAECFEDGTWTNFPRCDKTCPVPLELQNVDGYPTIVSANILTLDGELTNIHLIDADTVVLDDSEVTFSCAGGSFMQNYQKIYCNEGEWIYMPGCRDLDLGIDCVVDVSCSVLPQSDQCVNRICRCPLGTSYSYTESRCIEKCPNGYANTFNEVKNMGQWGWYNIESFPSSMDTCTSICLSRTLYTCRSFDYSYSSGWCYLQSVTYFDDPPSVYAYYGGAYFLRDCI